MAGPRISLASQIAAIDAVVTRATPHALVRGGFSLRSAEARVLRDHLAAVLVTLRALAPHVEEMRRICFKDNGK